MVATIWPAETEPPTSTWTSSATTPAQGAVTAVSIFMALTTISVSPAATTAPGWVVSSTTAPAIGHSTPASPSRTSSEGPAISAWMIDERPPLRAAAC